MTLSRQTLSEATNDLREAAGVVDGIPTQEADAPGVCPPIPKLSRIGGCVSFPYHP